MFDTGNFKCFDDVFFGHWARDQHIALYDIAAFHNDNFRFVGQNDVQLDILYDFHTLHKGVLMTRPVSFHMRCAIIKIESLVTFRKTCTIIIPDS